MQGIILAGGYSSRAKLNKLLLEVEGKPLICHTIETMRPYVDRVIVVTGRYDRELRPVLEKENVEIIYNDLYQLGMFSSILTGVKLVKNDDILLLPGDITNISNETYEKILGSKGSIRIPVYNGRNGHPLYLDRKFLPELKKESSDSNMHKFLNKHYDEKVKIEVNDPFIYFDVDTIDDYNELRSLLERK